MVVVHLFATSQDPASIRAYRYLRCVPLRHVFRPSLYDCDVERMHSRDRRVLVLQRVFVSELAEKPSRGCCVGFLFSPRHRDGSGLSYRCLRTGIAHPAVVQALVLQVECRSQAPHYEVAIKRLPCMCETTRIANCCPDSKWAMTGE